MPVELRASAELSIGDLAALFTDTYAGYQVPFAVDEPTLSFMVEVFDLELASSLVAVEDGVPVGLANLGLRGRRSWIGGVGVVPSRRGEGIGELLTRGLIDRARSAGATEMILEVIVENGPAVTLYEKLGFVRTRELEVLALPAGGPGGAAEDAPLEAARALVTARRDSQEPWQRDDRTVDHLVLLQPPPQGLVAGDAAAVYRVAGSTVSLVQAAGGERGLDAIIGSLRARGPLSAVNFPAGGDVAAALAAAGAEVTLRQYEMVAALG